MKLSKTALLFLAIGIFVILAAILGMSYHRQGQEQSRLNEELSLVQLRFKKLPAQEQLSSQQGELESRLAKAESQLKSAKTSLYWFLQSIEASELFFELAEASQVEVTNISSPGLATETLEEVDLSGLSLTVTVAGDVPNLIDFIYKWTKEYPTGVVESVEIIVPEVTDEEAEEEETETEEEKPSATVNLLIYTYEGN